MQCVASTLHTTSEHGVSNINTADGTHLGCQQSTELTPRPPGRFKWTRSFRAKDEIWSLRMCRHISNAVHSKRILSQCHFFYQKSQNSCPGFKFQLPRRVAYECPPVHRSAVTQLFPLFLPYKFIVDPCQTIYGVLRYEPEDRGLCSQWCHWAMVHDSTPSVTEMSNR